MADKTTLLTYETQWQFRLFDLMTASQQNNDYIMACTYGIAWLEVLGMKKIPERKLPIDNKSGAEMASLQEWFREILMTGMGTIKNTIDAVRAHYKKNVDIPGYVKQKDGSK